MKTILILIDFTQASRNAVEYTKNLICGKEVARIILLSNNYVPLYAQILPSADFIQLTEEDLEEERQKINTQLHEIRENLLANCAASVKVDALVIEKPLIRAVHETIDAEQADLLIAGSSGEQIIAIAKTSPIPVLLIPFEVNYEKIVRAVVPCDFATVSSLRALKDFRKANEWLQPEFFILNIDHQKKYLQQGDEDLAAVNKMLEEDHSKVYYAEDRNIISGILDFAEGHDVQLIIAFPGEHSFFYNLTHRSITHALALNASYPVLLLK